MSKGESHEKLVDLGADQSGAVFHDFLGHRDEQITIDQEGKATFTTNAGSVSVWVRQAPK
jgi:alpha-amylase